MAPYLRNCPGRSRLNRGLLVLRCPSKNVRMILHLYVERLVGLDHNHTVASIGQGTPDLIVGCLPRRLLMLGAIDEDTGASNAVACVVEVWLRREVCFGPVLSLGWQLVAMFMKELDEALLMWGCRVGDAQKPLILLLSRPAMHWF